MKILYRKDKATSDEDVVCCFYNDVIGERFFSAISKNDLYYEYRLDNVIFIDAVEATTEQQMFK